MMVRAHIQEIQSPKVHVSPDTKSLQSSGTPRRPGVGHALHANGAPSVASLCGSSRPRVLSGALQTKCLRGSVPRSSVSNASPWPARGGALPGPGRSPSAAAHCRMRPGLGRPPKSSGQLWHRQHAFLRGAVLENQDHEGPPPPHASPYTQVLLLQHQCVPLTNPSFTISPNHFFPQTFHREGLCVRGTQAFSQDNVFILLNQKDTSYSRTGQGKEMVRVKS